MTPQERLVLLEEIAVLASRGTMSWELREALAKLSPMAHLTNLAQPETQEPPVNAGEHVCDGTAPCDWPGVHARATPSQEKTEPACTCVHEHEDHGRGPCVVPGCTCRKGKPEPTASDSIAGHEWEPCGGTPEAELALTAETHRGCHRHGCVAPQSRAAHGAPETPEPAAGEFSKDLGMWKGEGWDYVRSQHPPEPAASALIADHEFMDKCPDGPPDNPLWCHFPNCGQPRAAHATPQESR